MRISRPFPVADLYTILIAPFVKNTSVYRSVFVTLFKDEKTEKEYRGIYGRKPLRTRFMTYDLTLMKL